MRNRGTAQDLQVQETPKELKSLLALNTAIAAARASEADKEFIEAARQIKKLADSK